jgi:hypothetical protein
MSRSNSKKEEKKKVIDNYVISEEPNREQKEWVERKMNDFYLECYVCDQCGQIHNPNNEEAYEENEFFNTVQELLDRYAARKSMNKEIKVNA